MQIKCPYCQTAIEVAKSGQYTCGQCRAIFRVDLGETAPPPAAAAAAAAAPAAAPGAGEAAAPAGVIPAAAASPAGAPTAAPEGTAAPAAPGATAPAAPGAAVAAAGPAAAPRPPAGARCAKHPEKDAATVCGRCGAFVCGLCTVPLSQGPHCPDCAERVRASDRATPWDRRKQLGWVAAAKQTVRQVLFEPTEFFRNMPREGGYESPIGFLMVLTILQTAVMVVFIWVGGLIGLAVAGSPKGLSGTQTADIVGQLFFQSISQVCTAPISAIIGAFFGGALLHVGLLLFGGAKHGYETSVRVYCFSASAGILMIAFLPIALVVAGLSGAAGGAEAAVGLGLGVFGLGSIAIWVWMIAVETIGLREAHETTTGKALGAVLLPFAAIFCCIGGLAGIIVAAGA
jgi:hypothetical protein